MEVFGIIGMSFGTFGLIAFVQGAQVAKELAELKKELRASGYLKDSPGEGKKSSVDK